MIGIWKLMNENAVTLMKEIDSIQCENQLERAIVPLEPLLGRF